MLNGYNFDSERLIVYDSSLADDEIAVINKHISKDSNEKLFEDSLLKYNQEAELFRVAVSAFGICTTYKCNLRCAYCGYSSTEKEERELSIHDVKEFVKDLVKKFKIQLMATGKIKPLIIYFTGGGEPTYRWELFTQSVLFIEEYCKKCDVLYKLSVVTNGILNNNQIDFVAKHFTRVQISYDGLPHIQNTNRVGPNVRNSNDIVAQTIQNIVKKGIPIDIKTTIWYEDCDKISEMYRHVFSLVPKGSDVTWSVYPVIPEGRALTHYSKRETINCDAFLSNYFELLENILLNEGIERIHSVYCPLFASGTITYFCGSIFGDEPFLQPDGSIVMCNESKDFFVSIGKIEDGNLEYYNSYENSFLKTSIKKQKECVDCIAYRFCKGGCPIWHLRNEQINEEPIECYLTKKYWTHIIESVINKKEYLEWTLSKVDIPGSSAVVYRLIKKETKNEVK